jgi:hypothetical protein
LRRESFVYRGPATLGIVSPHGPIARLGALVGDEDDEERGTERDITESCVLL